MEETKKALRSLLVSSPLICTVEKLNHDYKDFMGFNIPFKELGFNSLLELMHAMTDVVSVNGNSMKSQVSLIVSDKTAHVNDMVLKQKSKSRFKPHGRLGRRPNGSTRYALPPRMNRNRKVGFTSPTRNVSITKQAPEVCTRNNYPYSVIPGVNDSANRNNSIQSTNITHHSKGNVEKIQVSHVESIQPTPPKLMDLHVKLPLMTQVDLKKSDLHYLRRPDYKNIIQTQCNNEIEFEKLALDKDDDDLMRQLLFKKDLYNNSSRNMFSNIDKFIKTDQDVDVTEHRIPHLIQENLKCLISKFPNGIWCSDLPTEYKKEFNKSLHYEDMGYRCLINMCMDLYNIFICSKESSCDFKLYDVRKPLIEPAVIQDVPNDPPQPANSPKDYLPKLDWKTACSLIPTDVLTLGEEIQREFFDTSVNKDEILKVVVAEIYDISKFWIFKDDGRLDSLMDNIQEFYRENDENYLIPEDLLEVGLYCAVITLNEFHRAVIIGLLEDSVKVFFIDYGSLAMCPKNRVWFLKKCFCELPAQAIRARLAHIYPPVENSTWSREAIGMFKRFANMKSLEAKIQNIIFQKNIVEVYLENKVSLPGQYLNHFLCSNGLALMTNEERKVSIEDPHCVPKVKYIHLFPTFDEIEYWLVPSVEDIIKLSGMDVSPDLFLPQYFSRPSDEDLLDRIENRARKTCMRRVKLTKSIDVKMFDSVESVKEMESIFYGDAYTEYKKAESEDDADSNEEMLVYLNKLRRKRINKSELSQDVDDRHPNKECGSNNSTKEASDENDDIVKQFFGNAFVEESRKFNKAQVESSCWSQLNPQNLLELERYLSEDSDHSDSPLPPKLDYSDDSCSSLSEADYSRSKKSQSDDLKSEKDSLFSLSVSSSRSGIESMEPASMLNNTIELEEAMNSNESTYSDLIKLDIIIDNPITNRDTTRKPDELWSRKIEVSSTDPFGSLNEENFSLSGDIFSETGASVTQNDHSDVESARTNVDNMSNQNDQKAVPAIGSVDPNHNPHEPPIPTKYWTNAGNAYRHAGYARRNPENMVRPPPGFGPLPRYGAPFEVGTPGRLSTYQPWSTNSMDNLIPVNNVNTGMNTQQCHRQLSPFYGYAPPMIVNYNVTSFILPNFGAPPFVEQKKNTEK